MKKIILIIAIAFAHNLSFGQNFKELASYEFKTVESYETEKNNVLICANYLFNNPANQSDLNRLTSIQYIIRYKTNLFRYQNINNVKIFMVQ